MDGVMMADGERSGAPPAVASGAGENIKSSWRRFVEAADEHLILLLGVALLAVAALGIAADLRLPWLTVATAEGLPAIHRGWEDLRNPDAVAYEQRLLIWPLVAYAAVGGFGIAVIARHIRSTWAGPWFEPAVVWGTAYLGFIISLTGTRWLGFYLARLADTGPTIVRLHAAPFINLGLGLLLFLTAVTWIAIDARRQTLRAPRFAWSAGSAGVAAVGLLMLPLIPFAETQFFGGLTFHVDEFTLAVAEARNTEPAFGASTAIGWARLMLWGCLYSSTLSAIASFRAGAVPVTIRRFGNLTPLNVLFIAAGGVLVYRFYDTLPAVFPNTQLGYNFVLPATLGGLLVLWVLDLRTILRRSHIESL